MLALYDFSSIGTAQLPEGNCLSSNHCFDTLPQDCNVDSVICLYVLA